MHATALSIELTLVDIEGSSPLTSTVWISIVARCTFVTLLPPIVGKANTLATWTAHTVSHTSAITETHWRKRKRVMSC